MELLDLPDEVLHYISQCVYPEDFDAFLATSKATYASAQKRLPRHRELKAEFRHCTLDDDHPAELLHTIWEDSEVAGYIQTLKYTNLETWVNDDPENGADYSEVPSTALELLKVCGDDLLQQASLITGDIPGFDGENLCWGDETPAFALLLLLIPNLKVLTLSNPEWSHAKIRCVVRRVRELLLGQKDRPSYAARRLPLQQLHTVEINMFNQGSSNSIIPLVIFGDLPNLRTLTGHRIRLRDSPSGFYVQKYKLENSSVRHLELCRSRIEEDFRDEHANYHIVRDFLEKMPFLETFKFSHGLTASAFDAKRFCDMLEDLPAHASLKSLSVTSSTASATAIGKLRFLNGLKELEIDGDFFISLLQDKNNEGYVDPTEVTKSQYDSKSTKDETVSIDDAVNKRIRIISGTQRLVQSIPTTMPRSIESLRLNLTRMTGKDVRALFGNGAGLFPPALHKVSVAGAGLEHRVWAWMDKACITIEQSKEWEPAYHARWGVDEPS